jgi:hypothetical protein
MPGSLPLLALSLGWCHGPPGTVRAFYALAVATGESAWLDWMHRLGRGLLEASLPGTSPGYWNNVGQCCGAAGIAKAGPLFFFFYLLLFIILAYFMLFSFIMIFFIFI